MVGERKLDTLEERIGHSFQDKGLLTTALRHRSAGHPNNERLEFLGDAVLSQIVADHLFANTEGNEFMMTRFRSLLTDRFALDHIAKGIGLEGFLELGESLKGKISHKMLSDALEALIGAIYLDGGQTEAQKFVARFVLNQEMLDICKGRQDWITQLKERCDAKRIPQPKYITFEERDEADPTSTTFVAWVTADGMSGSGAGHTKKEATAQAAMHLMEKLGQD